MTSEQIQQQIVVELRNGPLDQWQIAGGIGQAPFRVLAELKALKRRGFVRQQGTPFDPPWELTASGLREAFQVDQQRLI